MKIHLEDESSRFFLMEIISCGRKASGERFRYRKYASKVSVWRSGSLIYRDNTRYEPEKMDMEGIGMYEGYTHMANIFLTRRQRRTAAEYLGDPGTGTGVRWRRDKTGAESSRCPDIRTKSTETAGSGRENEGGFPVKGIDKLYTEKSVCANERIPRRARKSAFGNSFILHSVVSFQR